MMIDLNLYRSRIGIFNTKKKTRRNSKTGKTGNSIPLFDSQYKLFNIGLLLYLIFIFYIVLGMVSLLFLIKSTDHKNILDNVNFFLHTSNPALSNISAPIKLWFSILIFFLIKQIFLHGQEQTFGKYLNLSWKCLLMRNTLCKKGKRFSRVISGLLCWLCLINLILIVVVNPSLLNPGPSNKDLLVAYQNVTGLIPFKELGKLNPMLDTKKVLELQSYLKCFQPGIVILNETWLTGTILDSEIIPKEQYKIFREDRTKKTHPPDANNPKKFRTYGGGVLIGVKTDLDIKSVKVSYKCSAEILAVTLTFKNGKKLVICTCYRVGTLGDANCNEITSYLQKLKERRDLSNLVMIGDFNFPSIDWDNYHSNISVDQNFLELFSNIGLAQLIDKPTHIAGNILDLLLTDNTSIIADIKVDSDWHICKSNHYPITFRIKHRADKLKAKKRAIYNFKKANWDLINKELLQIQWKDLLNLEGNNIEVSWNIFKFHLFSVIDRNIPKIKISNANQQPWFDSETFNLCRRKEWFRAKYKESGNPDHYAKFSDCRRDFKKLTEKKMQDNILTDDSQSDLITKKFWSHVQSKSKSSRIPETVHLCNTYRSEPNEQAELFNEYFYNQFTKPSKYDIPVDFNSGNNFNIEFFSKSNRRSSLSNKPK